MCSLTDSVVGWNGANNHFIYLTVRINTYPCTGYEYNDTHGAFGYFWLFMIVSGRRGVWGRKRGQEPFAQSALRVVPTNGF